MIGGRLVGFKGRPWSRKSPSAVMRHTRVTTDAWLSTLGKPKRFDPSYIYSVLAGIGGIILVGTVLGTIIFILGAL